MEKPLAPGSQQPHKQAKENILIASLSTILTAELPTDSVSLSESTHHAILEQSESALYVFRSVTAATNETLMATALM